MQEYQQRVVTERDELVFKLVKLTQFIYGNDAFYAMAAEQQSLMIDQLNYMQDYARVLGLRISMFTAA